jgi:transcriptional regulator of acetoin/glycerol metabolism/AraC-like DNA-binding protein
MPKAALHHDDRVSAAIEGPIKTGAEDIVLNSWRRSANAHRIDPLSTQSPRILTAGELRDFQSPAARLIEIARVEIDHLYGLVRPTRYVVLLCDTNGVVIDHRGEAAEAAQFRYWGTWIGGIWAEDIEGTNGIGTCLAEQRPITVHMTQHFRARHISLSCSGAPIFDGNGELAAVLDISSIDPALSEHAHALTGTLTTAAARAIGERLFREQFRRERIIAVRVPDDVGSAMLLAVDRNRRIVGADLVGRRALSHWGRRLNDDLWTVFESNEALLSHKYNGDVWTQVRPVADGRLRAAIATPPESVMTRHSSVEGEDQIRPRIDLLMTPRFMPLATIARGGLPPAALRRVRDYVDSHLDKPIDVESLAAAAGLSTYHFARSFKQSEGNTPHDFVLKRRLAKARELMSRPDLSLSEIAVATGFADQSHFTRRFHEVVGISPGKFRKSQM